MSSVLKMANRAARSNRILLGLSAFFVIIFLVISTNVFVVSIVGYHIHSSKDIKAESANIHIATKSLLAKRGNILDINGNVIVHDVISYTLVAYLDPERVVGKSPRYVVDKEATALALAPILGLTSASVLANLNRNAKQTEFGTKGRNLTLAQKTAIESLGLPGFDFIRTVTRNYPMKVFSSHLIGFAQYDATKDSLVGKMGVEAIFDSLLSGQNGYEKFRVDKNGYRMLDGNLDEAATVDGSTIVLTLDKGIQEALEMAFDMTINTHKAELVWGSVMEIATGRILAWGHAPSFDPNNINISNYSNVGMQYAYEPGSTMKTFTYAAAMDIGKYVGSDTFDSNFFRMGIEKGLPVRTNETGKTFAIINNYMKRSYGRVDFDFAYLLSLNTGIATLLTTILPPSTYEEYLDKFGFFKPVNTDVYPEVNGVKNFRYPLEMITTGFGQGSSVTMLQLLQAYSAIFSDGTMVKPYFVEKIFDEKTSEVIYQAQPTIVGKPIKETTARQMQALMDRTINDGGTSRNYQIPEVRTMGKTGTSQVAVDGAYSKDKNIYSAMTALPAENPKYMVYYAFLAPTTTRAHQDTSAVQHIYRRISLTYGVYSQDNGPSETVPVIEMQLPNFINRTTNSFLAWNAQMDVQVTIIGDGERIINQYPSGNTTMLNTQRLFVLTDGNNVEMPDMVGWSRKDVTTFWLLSNRAVVIEGSGLVVSQSIKPGTLLDDQSDLSVILSLKP
jgi:penicillin-binding protein 2B